MFECVPHYYIEDAWITGFLADYRNVSRRWLPGHYITIDDRGFAEVRTTDATRPVLAALLRALTKSAGEVPESSALALQRLGLSGEWVAEQLAARALHVNGAHLKTSARELRCLWQRGATAEQLYLDFLEFAAKTAPKAFQLLVERHAERALERFPEAAESTKRRELVRFGCHE